MLIGLHRPVESEEVRVATKGFGKDPVAFSFAFATERFALPRSLGLDDRDLTVGGRSDAVGLTGTLGAELGSLPIAFRIAKVFGMRIEEIFDDDV